jgi:hypothetical protein
MLGQLLLCALRQRAAKLAAVLFQYVVDEAEASGGPAVQLLACMPSELIAALIALLARAGEDSALAALVDSLGGAEGIAGADGASSDAAQAWVWDVVAAAPETLPSLAQGLAGAGRARDALRLVVATASLLPSCADDAVLRLLDSRCELALEQLRAGAIAASVESHACTDEEHAYNDEEGRGPFSEREGLLDAAEQALDRVEAAQANEVEASLAVEADPASLTQLAQLQSQLLGSGDSTGLLQRLASVTLTDGDDRPLQLDSTLLAVSLDPTLLDAHLALRCWSPPSRWAMPSALLRPEARMAETMAGLLQGTARRIARSRRVQPRRSRAPTAPEPSHADVAGPVEHVAEALRACTEADIMPHPAALDRAVDAAVTSLRDLPPHTATATVSRLMDAVGAAGDAFLATARHRKATREQLRQPITGYTDESVRDQQRWRAQAAAPAAPAFEAAAVMSGALARLSMLQQEGMGVTRSHEDALGHACALLDECYEHASSRGHSAALEVLRIGMRTEQVHTAGSAAALLLCARQPTLSKLNSTSAAGKSADPDRPERAIEALVQARHGGASVRLAAGAARSGRPLNAAFAGWLVDEVASHRARLLPGAGPISEPGSWSGPDTEACRLSRRNWASFSRLARPLPDRLILARCQSVAAASASSARVESDSAACVEAIELLGRAERVAVTPAAADVASTVSRVRRLLDMGFVRAAFAVWELQASTVSLGTALGARLAAALLAEAGDGAGPAAREEASVVLSHSRDSSQHADGSIAFRKRMRQMLQAGARPFDATHEAQGAAARARAGAETALPRSVPKAAGSLRPELLRAAAIAALSIHKECKRALLRDQAHLMEHPADTKQALRDVETGLLHLAALPASDASAPASTDSNRPSAQRSSLASTRAESLRVRGSLCS